MEMKFIVTETHQVTEEEQKIKIAERLAEMIKSAVEGETIRQIA